MTLFHSELHLEGSTLPWLREFSVTSVDQLKVVMAGLRCLFPSPST